MPLVSVPFADYRVSYNGHVFDGATTEVVDIKSQCVLDSAQRTIIYMRYLLTIRSVIYSAAGSTTDTSMDAIRRRLQSPGGDLLFEARGFGNFSINTNGARPIRDVKWGPIPKELSWTPWGDANAAQIEWQVEVCIPECDAAKYEDAILEYCYRVEYMVDGDGFTTRRISGHLVIPQTRDDQRVRRFRHSADEFREKLQPLTPEGFRPLPKTFTLSEDKCRLDFTLADEQMGTAIPPPGCIRVDASMAAQTEKQGGFASYVYSLNATYDLVSGVDSAIARGHFKQLVTQRRDIVQKAAGRNKEGKPMPVVPWGSKVSEPKMYGKLKICSFSVNFFVAFNQMRFLQTAGFWQPVPDSNWQKWKAKLGDLLFNTRGNAGLKFNAKTDDVIIDLCNDTLTTSKLKGIRGPVERRLKTPAFKENEDILRGDNWIVFEQSFSLIQVDSPMVHKPYGPDAEVIIATRCKPTWYLVHTGRAMRNRYPIAPVKLEALGSFKLVPANRDCDRFVSSEEPGMEGFPLHKARWRQRYLIATEVGVNGPPPNPMRDQSNVLLTTNGTTNRLSSGGRGLPRY
jgi:hypothetical protein